MVNPHLRNIDEVMVLAQIEANNLRQDQVIYKSKDIEGYEIFKFVPEKGFQGIVYRIVRYAGENKHKDVLQDSGNKRENVVGDRPKPGKQSGRRNGK